MARQVNDAGLALIRGFETGDGQPKLKWSSTNVFSLDASGKPVYNFTILDQIFDEYKAAGVRPMVELGFSALAQAGSSSPPSAVGSRSSTATRVEVCLASACAGAASCGLKTHCAMPERSRRSMKINPP